MKVTRRTIIVGVVAVCVLTLALGVGTLIHMPGGNGTSQDEVKSEIADVQQEVETNTETEKTEEPEKTPSEESGQESEADIDENEQEQTNTSGQESVGEPIGEYSVDELYSELNSNALRAEKTFQDQCILLTGVVSGFDSDGEYMSLGKINEGLFDYDTVLCNFTDESQLMEALNYNKGDFVTIKCVVTTIGELMGYCVDIVEFDTATFEFDLGSSFDENELEIKSELLTLTVPESWKGRFVVEESGYYDDSGSYWHWVEVYEKESYDQFMAEYDMAGGTLFRLCVVETASQCSEVESFGEVSKVGQYTSSELGICHVYVLYPTDIQFVDSAANRYQQMMEDIPQILETMQVD